MWQGTVSGRFSHVRPPLSVRDVLVGTGFGSRAAPWCCSHPVLGAAPLDEHRLGGAPPMFVAGEQASRPFVWFPLAGQRHAIDRRDRHVPLGEPMRCLCGVSHPRGGEGKPEWLWPTCEQCWEEACRIVGVRRPQE